MVEAVSSQKEREPSCPVEPQTLSLLYMHSRGTHTREREAETVPLESQLYLFIPLCLCSFDSKVCVRECVLIHVCTTDKYVSVGVVVVVFSFVKRRC